MRHAKLISALIWVILLVLLLAAFHSNRFFDFGRRLAAASSLVPYEKGDSESDRTRITESLGRLPLYFVENLGQLHEDVAFTIKGLDKTLFFTPNSVTFALKNNHNDAGTLERWAVKLEFLDSNPGIQLRGEDRQAAVLNHFKGKPEDWITNIPTYGRLVYAGLWTGIDLICSGSFGQLKYEFIVRPWSDPSRIRLAYRGATTVTLKENGALQVETPAGGFEDAPPFAYQEVAGKPMEVAMAYVLEKGKDRDTFAFGFDIGSYDRSRPLILDPSMLIFCGYIGGSSGDGCTGIALDSEGNAFVTGSTSSDESSFPVAAGPDTTHNGGSDVFVAKINAAGTALVYCGYIGGAENDSGCSIAVDSGGNAYVTGSTYSDETTFPVSVGPDLTYHGDIDAFVAKVSAAGTSLHYCGYIGGNWSDHGRGIGIDAEGNAYVAGITYSDETTFPVAVGPDLTQNGSPDAFVAKVKADGTGLHYCGFIGGQGPDYALGIAVDTACNAYVTGETYSNEATFPVLVGPDLSFNYGSNDGFVAKVAASGTALAYCGYIGGASFDCGQKIAVDAAGSAYVIGSTQSDEASFPVSIGPDLTFNGQIDAFVAKVKEDGTALTFCGYIGGTGDDVGMDIAVDPLGNAYFTGYTVSNETTFPVRAGPDLTYNGNMDCFLARLKGDGTSLDYCGYIGGVSGESCSGIAVDPIGNAYVAGLTSSDETTFPVTVGPDLTYNGAPPREGDGFVAKITAYHIFLREGNVNRGAGNAADVLFFNGSSGDGQRKMTIISGAWVSATMGAPPAGPSPAGFLLYVWPAAAGPQDSAVQPFGIGTACFRTPLSKGTTFPPPFTVANNVGHFWALGYPIIPNVPLAPSTIFNLPIPFQGTYTFQGFIFDTGSSGPGFSITNAIVLEVQ